MTQHVYLQCTKLEDGKTVPGDFLKHRGPVGENDDVESFTKNMADSGLKVHIADEYVGRKLTLDLEVVED